MDQSLILGQADRKRASERLSQFIASSVNAGRASEPRFRTEPANQKMDRTRQAR